MTIESEVEQDGPTVKLINEGKEVEVYANSQTHSGSELSISIKACFRQNQSSCFVGSPQTVTIVDCKDYISGPSFDAFELPAGLGSHTSQGIIKFQSSLPACPQELDYYQIDIGTNIGQELPEIFSFDEANEQI